MLAESNSFETYEEEFQSVTSRIQGELGRKSCQQTPKSLPEGIEDEPTVDLLSDLFSQCEWLLQQMGLEARQSMDEKEDLLSRTRLYKIQLKSLKDHAKESGYLSNKKQLLREATVDQSGREKTSTSAATTKDEMLSTRLMLNKQNQSLERARRSLAEMEDTAGDISLELSRNRETIESSHDRVSELSGLTNEANRIITRMKKRWF
jgi:hypothetical protein